ncbi:GTP 3',8-cyclase MoaA [Xenophilus arseniciresistens]|uniref:GTP 3',8-cyclase n=1 Tax=Xenophilus arseniciresistens TaxID=1283306 RepID=A0AAE3N7A0_9BURK|nr:GTP 3',8-cyclase MoaA [Xenophilus arseniciresistens]MDA7416183.1 GTP 3',8-cyclase MoaA [Xenophilus arseniciresistens]
MATRVIPLIDHRAAALPVPVADGAWAGAQALDQRQRPLTDLRISVTDRCNFRCSYCMPKEVFDKDYPYLPHSALLSFEEITRLAGVFAQLGVRKIRLTGGEPLLRKNIEALIEQLAALRTPEGAPLELALTTNGSLLARKAAALKAAGLQRVTVSLDGLDDAVFRRMNDVDFPVAQVLAGIDAALAAGLGPVKVNMVVKRGTNEDQILPMARHFREHHGGQVVLRFIEYMDVGATNGWRMDEVMPSAEVVARIDQAFALRPLEAHTASETAQRWGYADGRGEVGVISSVTRAFCHDCSRARLSTEGQLYLCLFAHQGHDLKGLLRGGADDARLGAAIAAIWQGRDDHYSEMRARLEPDRASAGAPRRVEMSYIGG